MITVFKFKPFFTLLLGIFLFFSCGGDDDAPMAMTSDPMLDLDIENLLNLGTAHKYEGWLVVSGDPVSTGTFSVNAAGVLSDTLFPVTADQLATANKFILTIEPSPDTDPMPSAVHILAGGFSDNEAELSVGAAEAIGADFAAVTGSCILATPTNGRMPPSNELSGIWWLSPNAADPTSPNPSLTLPTLGVGWKYEGWVIFGTPTMPIPVSTGKFTMASGADASAPFSGTMAAPPFPGEDFLLNAPTGLTFPIDLTIGSFSAVITAEPDPDNDPLPFMRLLGNLIPSGTATGASVTMAQLIGSNALLGQKPLPTGTATAVQ